MNIMNWNKIKMISLNQQYNNKKNNGRRWKKYQILHTCTSIMEYSPENG